MAKRRGARNSVNQQVLDDIVKMFADSLGFSEQQIKELYDQNQALKAAGGTPGASPVNVNYQGDITDPTLQQRLVALMENLIDRVQNDPTFGQGGNFNIQIGVPKKTTTPRRKRSTTPRVLNQHLKDDIRDLKDYVEQRADQIVQLIQGINILPPVSPPPTQTVQSIQPVACKYDPVALTALISTIADDIKAQYSSIDTRLTSIEGAEGRVEGTVSSMDARLSNVEAANGRVEGYAAANHSMISGMQGTLSGLDAKIDNLINGQVLLFQNQSRLSKEHKDLSKEHSGLRQGQSQILDKIHDLGIQYARLEVAVKAIQPYNNTALTQIINDGFNDLKRMVSGIQTNTYDDTALIDLIDRHFLDLGQRVDKINPEIKDVQTTLKGMQTKLNSLDNYDDSQVRTQLSSLSSTLAGMRVKLNSLDNYDDTALKAVVNSVEKRIAGMQAKLGSLHNYDDAQLKFLIGNISRDLSNMQGTLNGLHNYDDTQLRDLVDRNFNDIRAKIAAIKPYDDSQLRTMIGGLGALLGSVHTKLNTLHNYNDSQLKAEVGKVQTTLAGMQAKLGSLHNYDDAQLKQLVNDVNTELGKVKTKVDTLHNYDDTQLKADITDVKTTLAAVQTKVDAIKPYDDTQLKADLNQKLSDIEGKVDSIKPYDDSKLLASLNNMALVLGQIKGDVDGLARTDTAVMGSLSGIMGAINRISSSMGGSSYDDTALIQLINDKHAELIGKYGDLTTLIAQKAGEVNTYLAQRLGEFATRQELEQILDGKLANLPSNGNNDIQRIYDITETIGELLNDIDQRITSIEQNYRNPPPGNQPPVPPQPPQPGQPINNAQYNSIMDELNNIRQEIANNPGSYTDIDRRLLADAFHQIEHRLGETNGDVNRYGNELRDEIRQLRNYLQNQQQTPQQPGQQNQQQTPQQPGQQNQQQGQQPADQAQDNQQDQQDENQQDENQPDQQRDDSPRLEDEQQPVGDRLERELEPAPSIEVNEKGIKAYFKANKKAERLARGRDRLLRETYLRAEQGLVSEDGREVDLSKLKDYTERREFENRAVGCIATLCKQLYGDFNDAFIESDLMDSLVGFDRNYIRQMTDQLKENLSFEKYYQKATEKCKRVVDRISHVPLLCLDDPEREKVVKYTKTEGRVNPEYLTPEDMAILLNFFNENGEIPTKAIKDKPYFIPQQEELRNAA